MSIQETSVPSGWKCRHANQKSVYASGRVSKTSPMRGPAVAVPSKLHVEPVSRSVQKPAGSASKVSVWPLIRASKASAAPP